LVDQQSSDTLCCLQCSPDRFWSLKADSSKSLKLASIASESLRCKRRESNTYSLGYAEVRGQEPCVQASGQATQRPLHLH
jgi:hypothetical protein